MRTPPSSGSITTTSPSLNPYLSRKTFGIRICPFAPTLILSSTKADRVEPWFYKFKPCYYPATLRRSQGNSGLCGTTRNVVLADAWRDVGNQYLIEYLVVRTLGCGRRTCGSGCGNRDRASYVEVGLKDNLTLRRIMTAN